MQASHRKCFSAHGVLFPPSDTGIHRSLLLLSEFSPSAHNGSTARDGGRRPGPLLRRKIELVTGGPG